MNITLKPNFLSPLYIKFVRVLIRVNIFYGTLLISVFFAEGFYSKTSVKFGGKLELGSAKESCGVDLINIKTSSYGGGGGFISIFSISYPAFLHLIENKSDTCAPQLSFTVCILMQI